MTTASVFTLITNPERTSMLFHIGKTGEESLHLCGGKQHENMDVIASAQRWMVDQLNFVPYKAEELGHYSSGDNTPVHVVEAVTRHDMRYIINRARVKELIKGARILNVQGIAQNLYKQRCIPWGQAKIAVAHMRSWTVNGSIYQPQGEQLEDDLGFRFGDQTWNQPPD